MNMRAISADAADMEMRKAEAMRPPDDIDRHRRDDYLRALSRINRAERRARLRGQLDVVKAAQKAGLKVQGAVIEGVDLKLGQDGPKAPAGDPHEVPALFHQRAVPKTKVIL